MNFSEGNIITLIVIIFMGLGFLGFNSKLKKIITEFREHYAEINTQVNEFLATLSAALDDASVSDEEVKNIIREAKDLGEALKKLKELFKGK